MLLPTYLTSLPATPGPIRESVWLHCIATKTTTGRTTIQRAPASRCICSLPCGKTYSLGLPSVCLQSSGLAPVVPSDHPKETKAMFSGCAEPT